MEPTQAKVIFSLGCVTNWSFEREGAKARLKFRWNNNQYEIVTFASDDLDTSKPLILKVEAQCLALPTISLTTTPSSSS